jgi:predicted DNA-binding transcriptional regulator AlpA
MSKMLNSKDFNAPLQPGLLVNDRTVAAFLGIGRTKVWALAKDGTLSPVRLGNRCTRFKTDDIIAVING